MPVAILMPALSPTMTEGNIAKWIKSVGDVIVSGDIIAEVETDKATMEVEAIEEGKLGKIIFPEGSENVPVNKLIGVIALDGDTEKDIQQFIIENVDDTNLIEENKNQDPKNEEQNKAKADQIEKSDNTNLSDKVEKNKNTMDDRIKISPLAKRIAELKKIDISDIKGSGPNGRIIKKDIEDTDSILEPVQLNVINTEQKDDINIVKLSNIRKTIATRLQEAKSSIPHFYLKGKVQLDALILERNKVNNFFKSSNENFKISFNDYFIKALALSLKRVPSMNANWNNNGSVTLFNNVDISVAVATDDGLFTPIIRQACSKNIEAISKEIKGLAMKARDGKLLPDEYTGGAFSISNLGMYGVEEFSAIINPPQSGIIAIGDIIEDIAVVNGEIKVCKTMSYVVSVDHRIVDGAVAAQLIKYFNFYINNPAAMLI